MNSKGRMVYSSFIASILILGSLGFVQQSYAGEFEKNFVHAEWQFPVPPNTPTEPISFEADTSSFPLFDGEVAFPATVTCDESGMCEFNIPNLIDELDTKIMLIDIFFDPLDQVPQIPDPVVLCFPGAISGTLFDSASTPGAFFFDFKCKPNPFWERIFIQLEPDIDFNVIIWTETFDEPKVGGIFEGVDTTSLLVAGAQMNAAWLIPAIVAVVGIGIVIARKF